MFNTRTPRTPFLLADGTHNHGHLEQEQKQEQKQGRGQGRGQGREDKRSLCRVKAALCPRKRTRAQAEAVFMSDAEASEAFCARLERLKLVCSVCCSEGWLVSEATAPLPARVMHVAACGDATHATCSACLRTEVDRALFSLVPGPGPGPGPDSGGTWDAHVSVQCMFPFSAARCLAKYAAKTTLAVASDRAIAFRARRRALLTALRAGGLHGQQGLASRMSVDGTRALVQCPACARDDSVALVAFATHALHACAHCDAAWCTRCTRVEPRPPNAGHLCPCPNACPCLALSDALVPTAFSRAFYDADGWPKRKHTVAAVDVVRAARALAEGAACSREYFAACPVCRYSLHKTSACNSLTHCGRAVCNACGLASHPWEAHLPMDHWDAHGKEGCPQWDADPFWNGPVAACGYACIEDACFTDARECTEAAHGAGRARMHVARRALALRALRSEFPIALGLGQDLGLELQGGEENEGGSG
jgi:hypothetical protein